MKRISNKNFDSQGTLNNEYNEQAGGKKTLQIGPKLIPIQVDGSTFSTDCSSAKRVGNGSCLAIYNNSNTVGIARFGISASISVGSIGSSDSAGNVSIPLKANDWTYLSSGECDYIICSASTCFVYIMLDNTKLVAE